MTAYELKEQNRLNTRQVWAELQCAEIHVATAKNYLTRVKSSDPAISQIFGDLNITANRLNEAIITARELTGEM